MVCDLLLMKFKQIRQISRCICAHLLFLTEDFGILHYMAQATVQNWHSSSLNFPVTTS